MSVTQSNLLRIYLLGGFRITFGEQTIPSEQFRLRKARSLIKLLALAPSHRLHRDQLVEYLWPDSDPGAAANNLYQALFAARKVLASVLDAHEVLRLNEEVLCLCPNLPLWIDAESFEAAAARVHSSQAPDAFRTALALYSGDLLPEDRYEDWAAPHREALSQKYLHLLLSLAALEESHKDYPSAIATFQQALTADPVCEEAHTGLMRLFTLSGQRSAALAQYEACRHALEKDLGVAPAPATTALYQQISAGTMAAQPPSFQPSPSRQTNLPTYLIPFVGRQGLLASIRERLADPACRLLTLVGFGGSGKTRLAVESISSLSSVFPDGIFFIPLVGLHSPSAIAPAIAQTLGFVLYDAFRDPCQQVADFLMSKKLLLVLDNFEHLLDGAKVVTQILETAPHVKVLITSRARLDLLCETLLPIHGMRIPPDGFLGTQDPLQFSAVRLFIEGARRVLPDFEPAGADLGHILDICRLVEGMPLAILLAATWTRLLTLAEITSQLTEHSLDFLEIRSRDLPERQRSLRAVLDHSWHMLDERKRHILATLSVFRHGFTKEAAGQVCDATLVDLVYLADYSFIERTPAGRFEIHELMRQYMEEKLSEIPSTKLEIYNRHSRYFCEFLAKREYRLVIKNEPDVIEEISREIDNLRLAWDWAIERGLEEIIDLCQAALDHFLIFQGQFLEGKDWFARAAQHLRKVLATGCAEVDERTLRLVIARLDQHQARFCDYLRLSEQRTALYRSSLSVFQELGDQRGEAQSWREIGFDLTQDDAETGFFKAIQIYDNLGDNFSKARVQVALGSCLVENSTDFQQAERNLLAALATFRELGSPLNAANALFELGRLHTAIGRFALAKEYLCASLEIYQNSGRKYFIARGLEALGRVFGIKRDFVRCKKLYSESCRIYEEMGYIPQQVYIILALLELEVRENDYPASTRLGEMSYPLILKVSPPMGLAFQGKYFSLRALVSMSKGDYGCARFELCRALELVRQSGIKLWYFPVIRIIGQYLAAIGKKEEAIEMAVLAAYGIVIWPIFSDSYYNEALTYSAGLPPEAAAAAFEHGRARDLIATVNELIAAWKEGENR